MAVQQDEIIRRWIHQPESYWNRVKSLKKNDMNATHYRIETSAASKFGQVLAYRLTGAIGLIDCNPAWGSEALSRSTSYQLNLLQKEALAAGLRVELFDPKTGDVTREAPTPLKTALAASVAKVEHEVAEAIKAVERTEKKATYKKPSKPSRPRRKREQEPVAVAGRTEGIYGDYDPVAGF